MIKDAGYSDAWRAAITADVERLARDTGKRLDALLALPEPEPPRQPPTEAEKAAVEAILRGHRSAVPTTEGER